VADIFISYSKKDADQARLIAALLEAQAYSVWWDTSLETGDEFRQEITKELDAAKAVIVLWTENSVRSVWVNAEASRALHSDRKLVPLKARLLPGDQIPLPFSELQTTNFDDHEAVLAAVKKQLAKPPAPPAVWKKVQSEALSWFGVVGTVLTIAGFLSTFIVLACPMHWLVENFSKLMLRFWSDLWSIVHIKVSPSIASHFSMLLFYAILTFGSVMLAGGPRQLNHNQERWLYPGIYIQNISMFVFALIYYLSQPHLFLGIMLSVFLILVIMFCIFKALDSGLVDRILTTIIYCILLLLVIWQFPNPLTSASGGEIIVFLALCSNLYVYPVMIAPTKALAKRVKFVLIGVVLIFGLSKVSELLEHFSGIAPWCSLTSTTTRHEPARPKPEPFARMSPPRHSSTLREAPIPVHLLRRRTG
jgi:hypothetical protein